MYVSNRMLSLLSKILLFCVSTLALLIAVNLLSGGFLINNMFYYTTLAIAFAVVYYFFAVLWGIIGFLQKKSKRGTTMAPHLKGAVIIMLFSSLVLFLVFLRPVGEAPNFGGPLANFGNMLGIFALPLLALADWIFFDRKGRFFASDPIVWLLLPYLYYTVILVRAQLGYRYANGNYYPYSYIDVNRLPWADILKNIGVFTIVFLVLGYLLMISDKICGTMYKNKLKRQRAAQTEIIPPVLDTADPSATKYPANDTFWHKDNTSATTSPQTKDNVFSTDSTYLAAPLLVADEDPALKPKQATSQPTNNFWVKSSPPIAENEKQTSASDALATKDEVSSVTTTATAGGRKRHLWKRSDTTMSQPSTENPSNTTASNTVPAGIKTDTVPSQQNKLTDASQRSEQLKTSSFTLRAAHDISSADLDTAKDITSNSKQHNDSDREKSMAIAAAVGSMAAAGAAVGIVSAKQEKPADTEQQREEIETASTVSHNAESVKASETPVQQDTTLQHTSLVSTALQSTNTSNQLNEDEREKPITAAVSVSSVIAASTIASAAPAKQEEAPDANAQPVKTDMLADAPQDVQASTASETPLKQDTAQDKAPVLSIASPEIVSSLNQPLVNNQERHIADTVAVGSAIDTSAADNTVPKKQEETPNVVSPPEKTEMSLAASVATPQGIQAPETSKELLHQDDTQQIAPATISVEDESSSNLPGNSDHEKSIAIAAAVGSITAAGAVAIVEPVKQEKPTDAVQQPEKLETPSATSANVPYTATAEKTPKQKIDYVLQTAPVVASPNTTDNSESSPIINQPDTPFANNSNLSDVTDSVSLASPAPAAPQTSMVQQAGQVQEKSEKGFLGWRRLFRNKKAQAAPPAAVRVDAVAKEVLPSEAATSSLQSQQAPATLEKPAAPVLVNPLDLPTTIPTGSLWEPDNTASRVKNNTFISPAKPATKRQQQTTSQKPPPLWTREESPEQEDTFSSVHSSEDLQEPLTEPRANTRSNNSGSTVNPLTLDTPVPPGPLWAQPQQPQDSGQARSAQDKTSPQKSQATVVSAPSPKPAPRPQPMNIIRPTSTNTAPAQPTQGISRVTTQADNSSSAALHSALNAAISAAPAPKPKLEQPPATTDAKPKWQPARHVPPPWPPVPPPKQEELPTPVVEKAVIEKPIEKASTSSDSKPEPSVILPVKTSNAPAPQPSPEPQAPALQATVAPSPAQPISEPQAPEQTAQLDTQTEPQPTPLPAKQSSGYGVRGGAVVVPGFGAPPGGKK